MSILQDSGLTSNDLLRSLVAKRASAALNYQIIAQSAEDVQNNLAWAWGSSRGLGVNCC